MLVAGSVSSFFASISGRQLSDKVGVSLDHVTAGLYVPISATAMKVFLISSLVKKSSNYATLARGTLGLIVSLSILAAIAVLNLYGFQRSLGSSDSGNALKQLS